MKRFIVAGVLSIGALAGLAAACGGDDDDGTSTPDGGGAPEGGSGTDSGVPPADSATSDAPSADAADAATTAPLTVLSTTDDILDIDVFKGTLYLLASGPSRVETCSAGGCVNRLPRVASANMPAEMPRGNGIPFYTNARLSVQPLGAAEAVVVAQNGNIPCALDCVTTISEHPGIYQVSSQPPALLYKESFPEFTKGANNSTFLDSRGSTLWYQNTRNNEAPGSSSFVVLVLAANAGGNALTVTATRTDTRAALQTYGGSLLAGGHRSDTPYITASAASTQLIAIDTAAPTAGPTDTAVGTINATFLATTATQRFVIVPGTPGVLQQAAGAGGSAPVAAGLPGYTADSTLVGTELALLYYTAKSDAQIDAGTAGPIVVSSCTDGVLTLHACNTPTQISLDLDTITRVKDEAPYLYVLGQKAGKSVVIRFVP